MCNDCIVMSGRYPAALGITEHPRHHDRVRCHITDDARVYECRKGSSVQRAKGDIGLSSVLRRECMNAPGDKQTHMYTRT